MLQFKVVLLLVQILTNPRSKFSSVDLSKLEISTMSVHSDGTAYQTTNLRVDSETLAEVHTCIYMRPYTCMLNTYPFIILNKRLARMSAPVLLNPH